MQAKSRFRADMLKIFLYPLLALFLIPGVTLVFCEYAAHDSDAKAIADVIARISANGQMSSEQKSHAVDFFEQHPPSSACFSADPALARYRSDVCDTFSERWHFAVAGRAALWAVLGGLATLLAIGALGAYAFSGRAAQYTSLVVGWRLLTAVLAAEVLVQGAMLVWLAFWLTAYFFHSYFLKLIVFAGIAAGAAAIATVAGIFKRPRENNQLEGELLERASSPQLWEHVDRLAQQVGTEPPHQIVAGIDANFFVAEAPLTVGERKLSGRSLFVSVPLLRLLERHEADAVLAHELAHLQGGDTASSAALGPKLVQYDQYCRMMRAGGLTLLVHYTLLMYRVVLEFAMKRDSREREFRADRVAASCVSARAIVQALVKTAAYASYRSQVERRLFEYRQQHGESLGIAGSVAAGLAPYAASANFLDAMKSANVPHPFDSHPPLQERMQNVSFKLAEQDYGALLMQYPVDNWTVDIGGVSALEQRLWQRYERRFAAMHEQKLAYTYRPANDAERAIVLKYFPPITIPIKTGQILITYDGLQLPAGRQPIVIPWDSVKSLRYNDGYGGDKLEIVHPEKGFLGAKTTKVTLSGIKPHRQQFKAALGRYWQRHQVMRKETAAGR